MKVLLISVKSAESRGGIATWTEHYLQWCDKKKICCSLVNIEMLGRRAKAGTGKRNFLDEWKRTRNIFAQLEQALAAEEKPFAVAHLNTSCGSFGIIRDYLAGRKICKKGIPLVVQYHCDIAAQVNSGIGRFFAGKLAACATKNLVLNQNSLRYLREQFGLQGDVVPNFVDPSVIPAQEKQISESVKKILFVGRISKEKGAAEIWELAKAFPQIEFLLIGEVGQQVAQWEKPNNITLGGIRSHREVLEQLDGADLFLLPSHSEGFSVALLEAMARGVPSVATDVGAAADMLAEGCGCLVPVGDVKEMTRQLRGLMPIALRQEMSRKAARKVREQYTAEAVMEKMKQYYQDTSCV